MVSIGIGAIVLETLGNRPVSAGAFSLSQYYDLDGIEQEISYPSKIFQFADHWNSVKVTYSGTSAGNIKQLAAIEGLPGPGNIDCHFVICNGSGGMDGQIQKSIKWLRQWPGTSSVGRNKNAIIIRLVADRNKTYPTEIQISRTEALVDTLSRKFNIPPKAITYPNNWRQ